MGLFDRVERGLERAVKVPFAKAFRAEVQPVEIASAVRGAMDDRAAVLGPGRTIVPNVFTVELSEADYERLTSYSEALTDELVASAEEHADYQRYTPGGPVNVELSRDDELETGVFRLRPSTVKNAPARPAPPSAQPAPQPRRPQQRPRPVPGQYARQQPTGTAGSGPAPAPPPAPGPGPASGAVGPGQGPEGGADAAHTRAFAPAPRPPRPQAPRGPQPWLDIDGQRYPLAGAITVLGRDDSADVVLDDPGISRRHSELRVTADGPHLVCSIRDLGSTNGTFVNGDRVQTEWLNDGDRVTVGRTSLIFHLGGRR